MIVLLYLLIGIVVSLVWTYITGKATDYLVDGDGDVDMDKLLPLLLTVTAFWIILLPFGLVSGIGYYIVKKTADSKEQC
jgi:hypothetical protein